MDQFHSFDPDWSFASQHGQASKVGQISNKKSNKSLIICSCCLQFVNKEPISLTSHPKRLDCLGFGFPLMYTFIKDVGLLLLATIFSYNIVSLWLALNEECPDIAHYVSAQPAHHQKQLRVCTTFMIRIARKNKEVTQLESLIRIASFCLHLVLLIYIRTRLIKLESYYDERTTDPSDYAIIMKNIPQTRKIQSKLRLFFKQALTNPHHIEEIILLPQMKVINNYRQKREKLIKQLRKYYENEDNKVSNGCCIQQMKDILAKVRDIQEMILEELDKDKIKILHDEMVCLRAILIFNTDEEKEEIIAEFEKIPEEKVEEYFGEVEESITVKESPGPKQIIWDHIGSSSPLNAFARKASGWLLSLVVLAVITVIFFFVLRQKARVVTEAVHNKDEDQLAWAIAIVYIMLFIVFLFNKIVMSTLFHIFTEIQNHTSADKFQFSFALKYSIGLFFTTALMTLAVEDFASDNYYSHLYGVIEEETVMFFINAFFLPIYWLINPFYLAKHIKRKMHYGKKSLTQKEANQLMEDTQYEMGKRYAEVIEISWFIYLYLTLIPIGAMLSVIGLFFYYWVDKYNLLRRSSLKSDVSGNLVFLALKLLDLTLFLRSVGEIFFDERIRHGSQTSSIIVAGIGLFYFLLPTSKFIKYFNRQNFNFEEKTYEEAKLKMRVNYRTFHPLYSKIFEKDLEANLANMNLIMSRGKDYNQRYNLPSAERMSEIRQKDENL